MPALTDNDIENIKLAGSLGITGIMQPFVRSAADLEEVRKVLDENGGKDIKIYAKIENTAGVENLESFFEYADEIVIARGDLGNAVPLWELPRLQKDISARCRAANMPFMVVTQMLSSMEHSKVPTRAEVSDIYNAVLDGAHSVMVTGETAVGDYPVDVISYLSKTANFLGGK
jgi:pyruvate kinase